MMHAGATWPAKHVSENNHANCRTRSRRTCSASATKWKPLCRGGVPAKRHRMTCENGDLRRLLRKHSQLGNWVQHAVSTAVPTCRTTTPLNEGNLLWDSGFETTFSRGPGTAMWRCAAQVARGTTESTAEVAEYLSKPSELLPTPNRS